MTPTFLLRNRSPPTQIGRVGLSKVAKLLSGGSLELNFVVIILLSSASRLRTAAALLHALLTEFLEFEAAKPVRAAGKRSLEPTLIGLNHLSDCGGTPLTLSPTLHLQEFHPEIRRRRA